MSAPNLAEDLRSAPGFRQERNLQAVDAPEPASEHADPEHGLAWIELARIGFVALAAAAVWFRVWEPFPRVSIIAIVATLIGGYPIFKEAWENVVERKMTMELSMTIALLAALAIGEFFTALVITAFVLAAKGANVGTEHVAVDLLYVVTRALYLLEMAVIIALIVWLCRRWVFAG